MAVERTIAPHVELYDEEGYLNAETAPQPTRWHEWNGGASRSVVLLDRRQPSSPLLATVHLSDKQKRQGLESSPDGPEGAPVRCACVRARVPRSRRLAAHTPRRAVL